MNRVEFLEKFTRGGIMPPWEPYRNYLVRYAPSLWLKHEIAAAVKPSVIIELGVRCGYSMWAMANGWRAARYIGYDRWWPTNPDDPSDNKEMQELYYGWAVTLADFSGVDRFELHEADTQASGFRVPAAQLYHVDAAHTEEGCYRDIATCAAAMPVGAVIVVHDYNDQHIRAAIAAACKEFDLSCTPIHNEWGDAILMRGGVPEWVVSFNNGRADEWWDPHVQSFARQLCRMWLDGLEVVKPIDELQEVK